MASVKAKRGERVIELDCQERRRLDEVYDLASFLVDNAGDDHELRKNADQVAQGVAFLHKRWPAKEPKVKAAGVKQ